MIICNHVSLELMCGRWRFKITKEKDIDCVSDVFAVKKQAKLRLAIGMSVNSTLKALI